MTPIFVTDLAFAMPGPLPLEGNIVQHHEVNLGYAAIAIGTRQQVQGPVLRRHRDGRVTIDAGGRTITGHPVNSPLAARSPTRRFWARLGGLSS